MAGLTGFSYYKEITISNTNVSADITNGIAFVPIVNDTDIGGHCLASGFDIQFSNSDNTTVLTFERLAGFVVAAGSANGNFYVLVPTVTTATTTVIRCYYGNAGASDVSSPENTFATANGWTGVWHMEEAPASVKDATANNMDITSVTSDPASVTGLVANGVDFDTNDNMIIQDACPTLLTATGTIEFWYKQTGTMPQYARFLDCQASGTVFYINKPTTGTTTIQFKIGTDYQNFTITSIWDGAWHHGLFTWTWRTNGTAGTSKFYHNGTQEGGDVANWSAWPDLTAIDFILSCASANYSCCGTLDEVRIANAVKTAAYAKFTYYNSHDGHAAGNELTWGVETSLLPPSTWTPKVIMVM
jgi:hypothetical protein